MLYSYIKSYMSYSRTTTFKWIMSTRCLKQPNCFVLTRMTTIQTHAKIQFDVMCASGVLLLLLLLLCSRYIAHWLWKEIISKQPEWLAFISFMPCSDNKQQQQQHEQKKQLKKKVENAIMNWPILLSPYRNRNG